VLALILALALGDEVFAPDRLMWVPTSEPISVRLSATVDSTAIRSVVRLVDHGDPADRWDVVIIGDGFREDDIAAYDDASRRVTQAILTAPPFCDVASAINVHQVNVISHESGVSDLCSGVVVDTFFAARSCVGGLDRRIGADKALARQIVTETVPHADAIILLVNTAAYGGSGGGGVAVVSLHPQSADIALHELGHVLGLADEYPALSDCADPGGIYVGDEPAAPNVSRYGDGRKWATHPDGRNPTPNRVQS
jgi:hypothetical protein